MIKTIALVLVRNGKIILKINIAVCSFSFEYNTAPF